jgi:hypothetical protein
MRVVGENRIYKAVLDRDTPQERRASSERHFCSKCSAMLWLWDEHWYAQTLLLMADDPLIGIRPELLHPFASAIDEPELKVPEEMVGVNPHRVLPATNAGNRVNLYRRCS